MSIQLHLETCGFCSAKCHFCMYDKAENRAQTNGHMPLPIFHKIIHEAVTIPHITEIAWSGLSEPLLDPHLVERVAYAHAARPEWLMEMYTNGVLLTPEKFEALKTAGMNCFSVSLNSINQEQHEKIMGLKGKFDLVCANIDYAIAHKDKVAVLVKTVINHDQFTYDDGFQFVARWGSNHFGGHGGIVNEMNWADQLDRTIRKFDPNSCCELRALAQISVHWDGRVNLCCLDPLGKYPWGDLKTQTIREIYNSPAYVQFREDHANNQAARHPMCAVCTRV